MFFHLYSYRLKIQLKNKILLFWTLAFPLILGLFFAVTMGGIADKELSSQIPVAIVQQNGKNDFFAENFVQQTKSVNREQKQLFVVEELSLENAQKALQAKTIAGYYQIKNHSITLFVNQNDTAQSILQSFMDKYLQTMLLIDEQTSQQVPLELEANQSSSFIKNQADNTRNTDQKSFYFFALIGMSCMFGLYWSMNNSQDDQANQSANGMRMTMLPQPKLLVTIANLAASFTFFMAELLLILVIYRWIYRVDLGSHWGLMLFTCALGALVSLSFGLLFNNLLKIEFSKKISIATAIQVFLGFLAGMMNSDVAVTINQYAPIINRLNPANQISEALYKLYYYQSLASFWNNILTLFLMFLLFTIASIHFGRKMQYANL